MTSSEALAITYGLSSAITWGAGDFSGGFATKKTGVWAVLFYSQMIGGLLLIGLKMALPEGPPGPGHLMWGGLAGSFGVMGLAALYKGLATGRMGVVAPFSAVVTALVPIGVAVFNEGLPRHTQMIGFGGALAAVWLLCASRGPGRVAWTEVSLSLLSGIGFGLFFVCIDRVSHEAILWPLVSARICSVSIIGAILVLKGAVRIPARDQLPFIAVAGILDTAGNAFFALASQVGRLDVVSVIVAALYPVATVGLARWLLKERVSRQQRIGLLVACLALGLIAA